MTDTTTQPRRRPRPHPPREADREPLTMPPRDDGDDPIPPPKNRSQQGLARRAVQQRSLAPVISEARIAATKPLIPVAHAAREKLKPVVHAGVGLAGAAMVGTQMAQTPGSTLPMALATVVIGPATWYAGRQTIERQMAGLPPERIARARRFSSAVATAAGGWFTSAAALGVDPNSIGGKINLTVGGLIGLWAASPYVRFRNQPRIVATPEPEREPEPTPEEEEEPIEESPMGFAVTAALYRTRWAERVAISQGALPSTSLDPDSIEEIKGGWTATIVSDTPGLLAPERFVPAGSRVAAAYGVGLADVTIETAADNASKAQLTLFHDNPLISFQHWAGPYAVINGTKMFDTSTGVALIGLHADADLVRYRFWNQGGAWHDLISGATGSGKSEFVSLLLAYERHAVVEVPVMDLETGQPKLDEDGNAITVKKGLIVSRIIDPQWGQSFGDWQDSVDWFAPTIDEARILLQKTEKEMYARNRAFGRTKWYDEKRKKWRRGVKDFPLSPDMPLIVITIDEAHEVLKDDECKRIVAKLGKMGRKTGIKLRLITQVPLLQELGGDMAIRDAVAGGNVVVFRTANSLSGQVAFNGGLDRVQPHTIPREWPKGRAKPGEETTAGLGYALGPSSRSAIMRAFYPGDAIDWMYQNGEEWGIPGVLDRTTREAGTGYEDRHQRLAELDDLDEIPDGTPAGSRRATGMTCAQVVLAAFLAKASDDYKLKLEDLVGVVNGEFSARMVSNVLKDFGKRGWVISGKAGDMQHGWHQLTVKGREEAADQLSVDDVIENPAADEVAMLARS